MIQRGRKSAAQLAVVPISAVQRPEPPEELSEEEAAIWRATVGGMRPDWFGPETWPLLTAYCSHAALAQCLRVTLQRMTPGDKGFGRLAAMQTRESKTMASLATKLRITPQANRQSARDGRNASWGPKPWEF
jgi:hypothetical protein